MGNICIKSELRKYGLGSEFLNFIKSFSFPYEYDLILLNCGEQVIEFYRKNGFTQISPVASYIRKKKIEVDEDPVLCFLLKNDLKIDDLYCDNIFLGEDF